MDAYKVMLTLLHNHKRYEDIFNIYNMIRKHLELQNQFPHPSINCLAFSACYHLVKLHRHQTIQRIKYFEIIFFLIF